VAGCTSVLSGSPQRNSAPIVHIFIALIKEKYSASSTSAAVAHDAFGKNNGDRKRPRRSLSGDHKNKHAPCRLPCGILIRMKWLLVMVLLLCSLAPACAFDTVRTQHFIFYARPDGQKPASILSVFVSETTVLFIKSLKLHWL